MCLIVRSVDVYKNDFCLKIASVTMNLPYYRINIYAYILQHENI